MEEEFLQNHEERIPETHLGGWGSMVNFTGDIELKGSPLDFPMSHFFPTVEKSYDALSKAKTKATVQSFCPALRYRPV